MTRDRWWSGPGRWRRPLSLLQVPVAGEAPGGIDPIELRDGEGVIFPLGREVEIARLVFVARHLARAQRRLDSRVLECGEIAGKFYLQLGRAPG